MTIRVEPDRSRSSDREDGSPLSMTELPEKSTAGPLCGASGCEQADDYRPVITRLNDRWRVIEDRDAIQWILQVRKGVECGRAVWRGRSYCRTREALLRSVREHCGLVDLDALAALHDLPRLIGERP